MISSNAGKENDSGEEEENDSDEEEFHETLPPDLGNIKTVMDPSMLNLLEIFDG